MSFEECVKDGTARICWIKTRPSTLRQKSFKKSTSWPWFLATKNALCGTALKSYTRSRANQGNNFIHMFWG